MKSLTHLAIGTSLLGCLLQPALATTYDFSYTFGNGDQVTGSFDAAGDDGTYVNTVGISSISVSRNGVALDGPLIANFYDFGGGSAAPPVISFAYNTNAFIFSNCAQLACLGPTDPPANYNYFLLRHSNPNENAQLYKAGPGGYLVTDHFPNTSWSLAVRGAPPIPEPGTYALMGLGLAAVGLATRRRRLS